MQDLETWRTAIHEAGHAVIAHKLLLQVVEVSIIPPNAFVGGYCLWRMRSRRQSFNRVITAYAGAEAVWHVLKMNEGPRAANDYAYARQHASRKRCKQARHETAILIRRHRDEIVAFAQLLMKHPIIDGRCMRWWLKHPEQMQDVLSHNFCQHCGMTLATAA